ncbi:hypothetical protein Tco_1213817 [Tanacetum coccineum]
MRTRGETRFLRLRKVIDEYGPHKIQFELNDKGTLLPLGDHAAQWSNLIGEIVREFLMYYPSWHEIKEEKKARVLGILRMESFKTREYPSLIQTHFDTYTVDGVFEQDETRVQYVSANTPPRVPYTEDQIMAMVRKGKQQGHISGVGRVLAGQGRDAISINEPRCRHTHADVDKVKEDNKRLRQELVMLRMVIKSDDRMSQLLTQLESQHDADGMWRVRTCYIWPGIESPSSLPRRVFPGDMSPGIVFQDGMSPGKAA